MNQPKTPHEEIMNCIESTNDIVSKISEGVEHINDTLDRWVYPILRHRLDEMEKKK